MLICKILPLFKIQPGNLDAIPALENFCTLTNLIPGRIENIIWTLPSFSFPFRICLSFWTAFLSLSVFLFPEMSNFGRPPAEPGVYH